jgi:hypothetical protein
MQQIMHYSAVVGASWLSSNVLFVIVWSWLHSRKRHWMSGDSERPSIFTAGNDGDYLNAANTHYLSSSVSSLGPVGMPVNRAS